MPGICRDTTDITGTLDLNASVEVDVDATTINLN